MPENPTTLALDQLVVSLFAGGFGAGIVILLLRWLGPLAGRFVGTVLKTRAELDADRDRIIANLRGEIADMKRRGQICQEGWEQAIADAAAARARVEELERFIERFLRSNGKTRADFE